MAPLPSGVRSGCPLHPGDRGRVCTRLYPRQLFCHRPPRGQRLLLGRACGYHRHPSCGNWFHQKWFRRKWFRRKKSGGDGPYFPAQATIRYTSSTVIY